MTIEGVALIAILVGAPLGVAGYILGVIVGRAERGHSDDWWI